MSETPEIYKKSRIVPSEKVQHILLEGTNRGYGLTVYSVLAYDKKSLTYSYSVFNPKDGQFKKTIGLAVALSHYIKEKRRTLDLTNVNPKLFSARTLNFLILWDILSEVTVESENNPKRRRSKRFIYDLRDYLFMTFTHLKIFTHTLD